MAVEADVIKITVNGTLAGQAADNVYHYLMDTGTATATQILDSFVLNVLNNILPVQSQTYSAYKVIVNNLQNVADNAVMTYTNKQGARSGDCNPSFVAYGFEFIPFLAGVNHGGKRIAGCAETDVSNSLPSALITSQLNTIANIMGSYLGAGVTGELRPVIARYVEDIDGHQIFQAAFGVSGVAFKRVTSQVSRLLGRGS